MGLTRKGFVPRVRQGLVSLLLAIGMMVGFSVTTAAPAQAAGSLTYYYPVYHNQVCNRQGHFGASYSNPYNPYSWYCYDLSFPAGITFTGGLDINGWCQATYPGSYATLYTYSPWGWKCARKGY